MSRAIELTLRDAGVPYLIVAGTEFFQRQEVKDLLAYARLIENPNDDAAFLRIVNVPRRGVGKTSVERLRKAAFEDGTSLLAAAHHLDRAGIRGPGAPGAGQVADPAG